MRDFSELELISEVGLSSEETSGIDVNNITSALEDVDVGDDVTIATVVDSQETVYQIIYNGETSDFSAYCEDEDFTVAEGLTSVEACLDAINQYSQF